MKIFIIIGEELSTYGAFKSLEEAEKERKQLYKDGYFGMLEIAEDTLS